MLTGVNVVLRRTVYDDIDGRFDNLNESHHQNEEFWENDTRNSPLAISSCLLGTLLFQEIFPKKTEPFWWWRSLYGSLQSTVNAPLNCGLSAIINTLLIR